MTHKSLFLAFLIIGSLCFNASAGCGKWVPRATDYLQDPIMDMNDPEIASETSVNQTTSTSIQSQPAAASASAVPKLDISGKWSFKLNSTTNQSADLILIQSASWADDGKDRIQGYGSLFENNLVIPLTATGSLSNDALNLELKPSASGEGKSSKKYVLQMALGQKDLLGTYEIYSSDVIDGKGNATATRLGA